MSDVRLDARLGRDPSGAGMTIPSLPAIPLAHRWARSLAVRGYRGARAYWAVADRLAVAPDGPVVRLPNGVPLATDARDWVAANAYRGLYERAELQVVRGLLRAGDTVVDVGANIGYFSATAASIIGPGGRIIAVEPSPRCQGRLDAVLPHVVPHVALQRFAAGAEDGEAYLTSHDDVHQTGLGTLRAQGSEGHLVEVRALGPLLELLGVAEVGLVKIDVEGLEADVLVGLEPWLGGGRARHLLFEVSPEFGPTDYAAELLASLGDRYVGHVVGERGRVRRSAVLRPTSSADVATRPTQFNLLVSRLDAEPDLRPFLAASE